MKRSLAYWAILFYVSVSKRVAVFLIHAHHHLPEIFFFDYSEQAYLHSCHYPQAWLFHRAQVVISVARHVVRLHENRAMSHFILHLSVEFRVGMVAVHALLPT